MESTCNAESKRQPEPNVHLDDRERSALLGELAAVYSGELSARVLLGRVGLSLRHFPAREHANSETWWELVFGEFDNGRMPDPYRTLLAEIIYDYPANSVFQQLALRHGVTAWALEGEGVAANSESLHGRRGTWAAAERLGQAVSAEPEIGDGSPLHGSLCQVPPAVADFTGREKYLPLLRDALSGSEKRYSSSICSLSGKGGVGKTTVAVRLAHDSENCFSDGQIYLNLRGFSGRSVDPAAGLSDLLRALGLPTALVPKSLGERIRKYREMIGGRHVLLILDNAVDESQVRPFLPPARPACVLVTSRTPLAGIEGARHFAIDVFEHDEAVEFLGKVAGVERIVGDRASSDEIVGLCGNLPLAVRIAGARLLLKRHWKLVHFAARLRDEKRRLDELEVGDLEVRATFSISYVQLSEGERRAFRLLSEINSYSFPVSVAQAALEVDLEAAEDYVERLVDAQLIDFAGYDVIGRTCYKFHDLIRIFARERARAEESPENLAALDARVFDAYLRSAEAAHAALERGA